MSKSAMGENPLDFMVPAVPAENGPKTRKVSVSGKKPKASTASPATREKKGSRAIKATFNLPEDLVNQARSAVVALAGPPVRLTLAALVEKALRAELVRLEKAHHGGQPFPPVDVVLRGGRPIGT